MSPMWSDITNRRRDLEDPPTPAVVRAFWLLVHDPTRPDAAEIRAFVERTRYVAPVIIPTAEVRSDDHYVLVERPEVTYGPRLGGAPPGSRMNRFDLTLFLLAIEAIPLISSDLRFVDGPGTTLVLAPAQ